MIPMAPAIFLLSHMLLFDLVVLSNASRNRSWSTF